MEELIAKNWPDYELIDSGEGRRLERFGPHTVVRPDSNVLWPATQPDHPAWRQPDARFIGKQKGEEWQLGSADLGEGWNLSWEKLTMKIKPTPFRHMGIFPEQAVHWSWLQEKLVGTQGKKVLNLFAYTGASTIVAAQAGAHVTHVDASKGTVFWASENARLSRVSTDKIRWIVDDVLKFVRREAKRGAKYDLIIMDPPVFGRGPKGEVWRLEEQFGELVEAAVAVLNNQPLGVLINLYATDVYPQSFQRVANYFLPMPLQLSTVCLQDALSNNRLPTGFSLRS